MAYPCPGNDGTNTGYPVPPQIDHAVAVYFAASYPPGYTAEQDWNPGPYPDLEWWGETFDSEITVNQYVATSEPEVVRMDVTTDGFYGGLVKIGGTQASRFFHVPLRDPAVVPRSDELTPYYELSIVMCGDRLVSRVPDDYANLARVWAEQRYTRVPLPDGLGDIELQAVATLVRDTDIYAPTPWRLLDHPYPGEPAVTLLGTVDQVTDPASGELDTTLATGVSLN